MKNLVTNFILAVLLIMSSPLFAQSGVGKLNGKIIDAQTREPLIGANVVVVNTNLGAASNVNGEYFILNIPPGTYDIRVSYVGYTPKLVTDVRIVGGITFELNIELSTGLELKVVEVTGKKFFEEKSTNTTKVFDASEIDKLPVKGVEQLASLQSGVVMSDGSGGVSGNATINVRGGRGGEVLYIVDGVPQNDIYTGSNFAQVSNAAIEQISFQIGGYEAKYGQAQSGIINVTTKTGDPTYSLFVDGATSTLTDKYGYNLYTMNLSGPIIPGDKDHTIFLSAERGWFLDSDPHAIGVSFNSDVVYSSDVLRNNSANSWKFTGKTNSNLGDFNVRLGANINLLNSRTFSLAYAKNNSMHNALTKMGNYSFNGKISENITSNSFWNLNLGYKYYKSQTGDGVWFDDLFDYGNSAKNALTGAKYWDSQAGVYKPGLTSNGVRQTMDQYGVFYSTGRTLLNYNKQENQTLNLDADFTSQVQNHLIEIGGGVNYNILRNFTVAPAGLASDAMIDHYGHDLSTLAKFYSQQPAVFGYDITGANHSTGDAYSNVVLQGDTAASRIQTSFAPRKPVIAYAYMQDRFELNDIVLNFGLRADYFDSQSQEVADPEMPFVTVPLNVDPSGYQLVTKKKKAEFYLSPRIGLGFPITATTVFHAQYGRFIQEPPLNLMYYTPWNVTALENSSNAQATVIVGNLSSEVTTQYEVGFRHVLGDIAALNITAFYKNTEGLINTAPVFYQINTGGQQLTYFSYLNTDFGTVKGLAVSLDITRLSFFDVSLNYTYALAEGTGSSTSSSYVSAFRNLGSEIPKVIAPLDFDQRHTGTINMGLYVPKGQFGILETVNANVLISFNSGRPYTPLLVQHLLATGDNTQYGDTKGYVNSSYGPGNFRVDFKLEKSFELMNNLAITPYVWVENLFNAINPVNVWRSTGDPYTTGWLNTKEGIAANSGPGGNFKAADYQSLERDPNNFGIPRLIRLGLKLNFSNISL
jgi:outer membrane receptor protein involved in Fe transport